MSSNSIQGMYSRFRKHPPGKLQDWLEVFTRMIAMIPNPVYFKDVSGAYRVFNSAFENFMAMTAEQLQGSSSHDVLPPDVADMLVEMDNRIYSGSCHQQRFQMSFTDTFGRSLSVMVSKSILNIHGFHQGIVGVITDVTELERTRQELDRSQQLLRKVFEAIPDLLSVQDRDLRVVQSNWHGGYGYVPKELRTVGCHCYEAYYPGQEQPCSPCHVQEVIRTGRPVNCEKFNPRVGHVEVHAFPLRDESGATVMVAEHVRNISDRKRAETASYEASRRLQAVIDASPLPTLAMDAAGVVELWNHAAEKVFGWQAGEIIGREYPLLPGQTAAQLSALFRQLRQGKVFHGDVVLRARKDGSTLPVSRYSAPLFDADGQFVGTMAVLEDITERSRAEDELKKSEANYRAIFDGTNDAIFVLDPANGAIIDVNRKMCEMYGCTREEALRLEVESFSSGQTPYTQSFALRYIQKAAVGDSQLFEWLARDMVGRLFWVEVNIKKILLGGVVRALASVRDITERKRAEEAHRESEERFRRIFELHEDAALIICPESLVIIDVNPVMVERYGFSTKRLLRQGLGLFLQQPEMVMLRDSLAGISAVKDLKIEPLVTFSRRDARVVTSFKAKLIQARGVSYAYCTFRDITERLRIREETKLMQAKLLQTNKMVALGTLSSGIAHEINNPANFILSNSQMLLDAWQDMDRVLVAYGQAEDEPTIGGFAFMEAREVLPKLLAGIVEGAHRIRNIVAGLKEFAREENLPLDQKVSINSVLEKAFIILRNQIDKFTGHFHCTLALDEPCVRGSFQQMEQVVINLTMNALQALPDRSCGVYVSVACDRQGHNVLLKVRDQGVGMSAEVQKRIFDPFFTTRLDSGGTGLGLSICYSIVKEHRGTIEVESETGRGTIVFVRLPCYQASGECP